MTRYGGVLLLTLLLGVRAFAAEPARPRQVAPDGAGRAYWSRDGRWFLVQSRDGEALLKYARDGKLLARTSLAAASATVAFDLSEGATLSPDGTQLLFATQPVLRGNEMVASVWRLDVASGKLAQVTSGKQVMGLLWLADSKRVIVTSLEDGPRHRLVDVATHEAEALCASSRMMLGAQPFDPEHVVALADRIYRTRLDCSEPSVLAAYGKAQAGQHAWQVALSPHRRALAARLSPDLPQEGSPQTLWVYSFDSGRWEPVGQSRHVYQDFVWLDDDTLIFEERAQADASGDGVLRRYARGSRRIDTLVPTEKGCSDMGLSAPADGGAVTFMRACATQDGWLGLIAP